MIQEKPHYRLDAYFHMHNLKENRLGFRCLCVLVYTYILVNDFSHIRNEKSILLKHNNGKLEWDSNYCPASQE